MWQTIKPALTYGATFLAGLMAGGFLMQKAFKKAMMQNYQNVMGNMDPQTLNALAQQMQGGAGIPQGMNVGMPQVPVQAPMANNFSVQRGPIVPLNLTAGQLRSGGGMRV